MPFVQKERERETERERQRETETETERQRETKKTTNSHIDSTQHLYAFCGTHC